MTYCPIYQVIGTRPHPLFLSAPRMLCNATQSPRCARGCEGRAAAPPPRLRRAAPPCRTAPSPRSARRCRARFARLPSTRAVHCKQQHGAGGCCVRCRTTRRVPHSVSVNHPPRPAFQGGGRRCPTSKTKDAPLSWCALWTVRRRLCRPALALTDMDPDAERSGDDGYTLSVYLRLHHSTNAGSCQALGALFTNCSHFVNGNICLLFCRAGGAHARRDGRWWWHLGQLTAASAHRLAQMRLTKCAVLYDRAPAQGKGRRNALRCGKLRPSPSRPNKQNGHFV